MTLHDISSIYIHKYIGIYSFSIFANISINWNYSFLYRNLANHLLHLNFGDMLQIHIVQRTAGKKTFPITYWHWNKAYFICFQSFPYTDAGSWVFRYHPRIRYRAAATSKTKQFVIIVNGWKPLAFITKSSLLDVAAVLDPSLCTLNWFPLSVHVM